jgi:LmbE family N-acetylglucosaminyl deacetylase
VLVLAAHPDDEMGCAGTVSRLADDGASIHLLTFSDCSDLNGPDLVDEWKEAANLLGFETYTMLNVPNRHFPEHRQKILDALDQHRQGYDLILTPASSDAHQDHSTVTREAVRALKHTTMLGYELPVNSVNGSGLRSFVALEQYHLNVKLAHAAAYRSQADKPYMAPAYIEGLARVRGVQAGTEYAEAYETIRAVL